MKYRFSHIFNTPLAPLGLALLVFAVSFLFTSEYSQRSSVNRERKRLENYIHQEEARFTAFLKDTALLRKLAYNRESLSEFRDLQNSNTGYFLFRQNSSGEKVLEFWSDHHAVPQENIINQPDGQYFVQTANGYYLSIRKTVLPRFGDSLVAYAMIPVLYSYFLTTDLFPDKFPYSEQAARQVRITDEFTSHPVRNTEGSIIFYLDAREYTPASTPDQGVIWLRILALIFFLVFLHLVAEHIQQVNGGWYSLGFLAASLLLLRVISYLFPFPVDFRSFELFDPSIYGANPIQKSLGDLLINSLLICWVVLYAWRKIDRGELKGFHQPKPQWAGVLVILALVVSTFITAFIIRSLAADSNISFDVMNFFSLNIYSVIGFILLCIICISYYYFSRILLQFIRTGFNNSFLWVYFIMSVAGLAYLTFVYINPQTRFFIFVLAWLILYTWIMRNGRFAVNRLRVNVTSSLFWMFFFSISITAIIIGANREKEWEIRKRIAIKMHSQSDPFNERHLSISLAYLDEDFLEDNFHRFSDPDANPFLRDSILRLSGYLSKYDTRLFLFDSAGRGLFNEEPQSINSLNTILSVQAKPTNTPNLYYYETSYDKFTFLFKQELQDSLGALKGTLFIVSSPKDYTKDALQAEIFRQADQNNPEESPIYFYGIYKDKKLVSPVNYSFPTSLTNAEVPYEEYQKRINGDYDELWYKAAGNKVVVIAKKRDSLIEAMTLFSYIFGVFLFLVLVIGLILLVLRVFREKAELGRAFQMNIRTQVHSTIIFISLLSFLVIGVATISFFVNRYKRNNEEKLSRTLKVMVNEMQKRMADQLIFDDVVAIHDTVSSQALHKLVKDVSDVHDVDVNVYDTSGHLKVTSQPIIYRHGYLSLKMQPEAYYYLSRLRRGQHIQQEQIASLSYLSIYGPVRNEEGEVEAYLNIPYFLSQRELNQEISNFIVTIINLNAFIFLIAGIIALFITNRITHSFSLISEKMKAINLGRANEEIQWSRDDEIGELVNEYNKMVNKLEESANALARSEREGAWREMARQVAHEIKNPLTPMKLSIQYLQKAIHNNNHNVQELTSNVARTLVEQIDHLAKIAADFSQFANIGNTNPETFDLHEVIHSLRDLYRTHPEVKIDVNTLPSPVMVRTDKTQMNRLFTNLLQNAVEACSGKDQCRITLDESKENGVFRVSITDNGDGIPPEMQSRIFVPNFTTKSSGTGLGLAMVKGIVEQAGGRIWFNTEMGKGTTFFVELPTLH